MYIIIYLRAFNPTQAEETYLMFTTNHFWPQIFGVAFSNRYWYLTSQSLQSKLLSFSMSFLERNAVLQNLMCPYYLLGNMWLCGVVHPILYLNLSPEIKLFFFPYPTQCVIITGIHRCWTGGVEASGYSDTN